MSINKLLGLSNCDFIQEIKSILSTKPADKWCINTRSTKEGAHCAFGWLDEDFPPRDGITSDVELKVAEVFGDNGWPLANANNGDTYQHIDNPKDRSLAFLGDWLKEHCDTK